MTVTSETAFWLAQRWVGVKEVLGKKSNPFVLGMLQLDSSWVVDDETAWCSAFVNFICWQLRLPRSKSLAARSWLTIGAGVSVLTSAQIGDVVILSRGALPQPDATVLKANGHVGFFAGWSLDMNQVLVLAGNQGNMVSVDSFDKARILGIRRLI